MVSLRVSPLLMLLEPEAKLALLEAQVVGRLLEATRVRVEFSKNSMPDSCLGIVGM